ncbi:MAG: bifunctional folylpolyglutamate synthase/dihydrofolate synthase [Chloroflexi bacterium]|nr:bifunctional folylpolyglutamate synthase/dihydrofolate synthase [Chloroflexota bacterium]
MTKAMVSHTSLSLKAELVGQYRDLEVRLTSLLNPAGFSAAANMRLERIAHLLELLGNPQRSFLAIQVGGTSGKGSTATIISGILTAAGYKTGLFLSPHVQILNELFQINGHMVATLHLGEILSAIEPAIARVAEENPYGRPSYFETQVAMAFCLFERARVDVAVVEVGLGGRTDATNVLDAVVAVITGIGLDHTQILGDTIELIAHEKAGIIKPGQAVVSGATQPSTRQIIAARCAAQGATLWQLGSAFSYASEGTANLTVDLPGQSYAGLSVAMAGPFQEKNGACAVAAIYAFDPAISATAVQEGLRHTSLPGRFEIVQHNPTVLLDGAHNPDKMQAAAQALDQLYAGQRRIVVLSLKSDKAYRDVLPYVIDGTHWLILTAFNPRESWQPLPPETLAQAARDIDPELNITVIPDPMIAITYALAQASPDDLIWITGSLYFIGNVREIWFPVEDLLSAAELHGKASHPPECARL